MNFRQVRKKIKTIKNVKKITNAMQMVSAVKMRKAQSAAMEGRVYRRMLDEILQKIIANTSDLTQLNIPWLTESEGKRKLFVLITSNKGLCGSFHTYLFKYALDVMDPKTTDFIVVGKKGAEFVSRSGCAVLADFSDQQPFTDSVSSIFSLMQEKYLSGEYKSINILFNAFVSSFKSEPTSMQVMPVKEIASLEQNVDHEEENELASMDYIIEPSMSELLQPLVEDYIKEKLRSAIVDSEAAEHSARMMAMKSATDNAGDLIYSLTLVRNKLRQGQITGELLDMIAAKESTA